MNGRLATEHTPIEDSAPIGSPQRFERGVVRQRLEGKFLEVNRRIWQHVPARTRDRRLVRAYGAWLHALVCRSANREMYLGTLFLRNRPALDLMSRLVRERPRGSTLRIAVLGCSIGVEVYSILWTLRSVRSDLNIAVNAVDISEEVLSIARAGIYSPAASELVHSSIFERLTKTETQEMFDWVGQEGRIKPWLRGGIEWTVGDVSDPKLNGDLGPQDLVVANNFLCHMDAPSAERCLRNLVRLLKTGGYLFVSGVDLDTKTKIALDLGWKPISELRTEIHDGDPLVRDDWPFEWWGLEPLDRGRDDWETRYAAVFRIDEQAVE
jgi:chemotaxis methyl-accepting protein methylase